ncbi:hypothetical protein NQZ68_034868 [Dissostichus eleginoides]|nr:hypothetical protein NQZ68_034868 [Dissostichus eleginoides]
MKRQLLVKTIRWSQRSRGSTIRMSEVNRDIAGRQSVDQQLRSISSSGRSAAQVDQQLRSISSSGRSAAQVDQQLRSISSSGRSAAQVDQQLRSISSSGRSAAQVDQQLRSISSSGRSAAQIDQPPTARQDRQQSRVRKSDSSGREQTIQSQQGTGTKRRKTAQKQPKNF